MDQFSASYTALNDSISDYDDVFISSTSSSRCSSRRTSVSGSVSSAVAPVSAEEREKAPRRRKIQPYVSWKTKRIIDDVVNSGNTTPITTDDEDDISGTDSGRFTSSGSYLGNPRSPTRPQTFSLKIPDKPPKRRYSDNTRPSYDAITRGIELGANSINEKTDRRQTDQYVRRKRAPSDFVRSISKEEEFRRRATTSLVLRNCYAICENHDGGRLALYCQDCQAAMCFRCKTEDHTSHKYTTIDAACTIKTGWLRRSSKELSDRMDHYTDVHRSLTQYEADLEQKHQLIMDHVTDHQKNLHDLVDQWYAKTVLQFSTVWKTEQNWLYSRIAEIDDLIEKMTDTIEHIGTMFDYRRPNDLLNLTEYLPEHIESLQMSDMHSLDSRLCAIFTSQMNLNNADIFGTVSVQRLKDTNLTVHHITNVKELHSFQSRPDNFVSNYAASGISITPEGAIIVTDIGLDRVQMFSPCGKLMRSLITMPGDQPSNTAVMNGNRLVVACRNSLKTFDANTGEFIDKIHDVPECPVGLACSPDSGVLVVSDNTDDGCILHIMTGDPIRPIHHIIGGIRNTAFYRPWCLAMSRSHHIFMTDYQEHTVKVFNAFGGLLHEFGGKGCEPGKFFHPAGLCIDKHGHVLVADSYNHRVQLFTESGDFLGVLLTSFNDGIESPVDLQITSEGYLVILQCDGLVRTFQYMW